MHNRSASPGFQRPVSPRIWLEALVCVGGGWGRVGGGRLYQLWKCPDYWFQNVGRYNMVVVVCACLHAFFYLCVCSCVRECEPVWKACNCTCLILRISAGELNRPPSINGVLSFPLCVYVYMCVCVSVYVYVCMRMGNALTGIRTYKVVFLCVCLFMITIWWFACKCVWEQKKTAMFYTVVDNGKPKW